MERRVTRMFMTLENSLNNIVNLHAFFLYIFERYIRSESITSTVKCQQIIRHIYYRLPDQYQMFEKFKPSDLNIQIFFFYILNKIVFLIK